MPVHSFVVGNKVRVKTTLLGSTPTMIVKAVDGEYITCFWFSTTGDFNESTFHYTTIDAVP